MALTSSALTVPRREIFPAGERRIREGFLEVVIFELVLEEQLDLDGQRGGRKYQGKRLFFKEESQK